MANRDGTGKFRAGESGNPAGRPRKQETLRADAISAAVEEAIRGRLDGWENQISGFGVAGRDKRTSTTFAADQIDDYLAMELWRGDDLAARAVEAWPNEMLRAGWEICVGDSKDKERAEALQYRCEELGFDEAVRTALCYQRAYGGGAVLMGIQDGGLPSEPVNPKKVRSIDWLTTLEPREIQPLYWYANPLAPKFGEVEVFQVTPMTQGTSKDHVAGGSALIHESRLLLFNGVRVSRMQHGMRAFWGDSVFTRIFRVLRDFNAAYDSMGVLLNELGTPVWEVPNLAQLVTSKDSQALKNRVAAMDFCKSVIRAVVIGKDEKYGRDTMSFANIPEVLDRFAEKLAAAMDMPVTVMMKRSPAGMNATGESDFRGWYDSVSGQQDKKLRPVQMRFCRMLWAGNEPKQWSIEFAPLWQPTEKEIAETRKIVMDTAVVGIDAQIITPEEARQSMFGGDAYSMEIQLDESLTAPEDFQEPPEPVLPPGAGGAPPAGAKPAEAPPAKREDKYNAKQPRDKHGRWGSGGRMAAVSAGMAADLAGDYEKEGRTEEVYGPGIKTAKQAIESMTTKEQAAIDAEERALASGDIKPIPSEKFEALTDEIDAAAVAVGEKHAEMDAAQREAAKALDDMSDAADQAESIVDDASPQALMKTVSKDIDDDTPEWKAAYDEEHGAGAHDRDLADAEKTLAESSRLLSKVPGWSDSETDEMEQASQAVAEHASKLGGHSSDVDVPSYEPIDGDGDGRVNEIDNPVEAVAYFRAKAEVALASVEKAHDAQKATLEEIRARAKSIDKAHRAAERELPDADDDADDFVNKKLYNKAADDAGEDQSEAYDAARDAVVSMIENRSGQLQEMNIGGDDEAVEYLKDTIKSTTATAKQLRKLLGKPAK